jgi:hypothetical protein
MQATHEQLHTDKWMLCSKRSWIYLRFILIIFLFEDAIKYGKGVKFWGYVGTKAESLCVEFCNSVQCRISVKYLTFCPSVCPHLIFEPSGSNVLQNC